MSAINDWCHEKFSSIYQSFDGAEAIYVERPLILHVRVTQVCFDDWGVKASITDLLSPGMHRLRRNPFQFAFAWMVFACGDNYWDTPNIPACRSQLFFHPIVIRPALELAAEANRNGVKFLTDNATRP